MGIVGRERLLEVTDPEIGLAHDLADLAEHGAELVALAAAVGEGLQEHRAVDEEVAARGDREVHGLFGEGLGLALFARRLPVIVAATARDHRDRRDARHAYGGGKGGDESVAPPFALALACLLATAQPGLLVERHRVSQRSGRMPGRRPATLTVRFHDTDPGAAGCTL